MRRLLGILLLSVTASAAYAQAQCESLLNGEFGCACAVSLQDNDASPILSNIIGDVEVTTSNLYTSGDPSVPLNVGDSVVVLEDSSAFLSYGPTCSQQLPEQSSLVIREVEGCACAALVEAQTQAATTGPTPRQIIVGGIGVAAAGTAIYFFAQNNDDDDDQPVTPD